MKNKTGNDTPTRSLYYFLNAKRILNPLFKGENLHVLSKLMLYRNHQKSENSLDILASYAYQCLLWS